MALITAQGKYVVPQSYLAVSHGHYPDQKLDSATISAQVDNWSRTDVGATVTKYLPNENKLVLSNGKEYTYKALVLAPGFDHKMEHIDGLTEMSKTHEEENVFVHMLSDK